jgi:hypothetical protein
LLTGAFVLISAAQMLRGHDVEYAATQGAIWGAISAAVFTVARLRQASRGEHCAMCKDTPEMREEE